MATTIPYRRLSPSQSDVAYLHGPDSAPRADVSDGTIEEFLIGDTDAYPGTSRRIWVHTPANHDPSDAAAVMFFNDGRWYLDPKGEVRGGIVLDNLSAAGALPPMIGVFVDPGVFEADGVPRKNRNVEYDAFDHRYASFLLDEVLPLIESQFTISRDPKMRGICGGSSGGNAAITAAWTRSDQIGRAIGFNSSFAQMPGGNPYPALLTSEPRRRLRVFLHAAHRDLHWNESQDNWFAENLETAAAFARAGYDFRLAVGDGGHSPNHGGVLLPDALRWLWSDASA